MSINVYVHACTQKGKGTTCWSLLKLLNITLCSCSCQIYMYWTIVRRNAVYQVFTNIQGSVLTHNRYYTGVLKWACNAHYTQACESWKTFSKKDNVVRFTSWHVNVTCVQCRKTNLQQGSVHENIVECRTFLSKCPMFPLNPLLKLTAKMGSYVRHLDFTSALSDRLTHFHIHCKCL